MFADRQETGRWTDSCLKHLFVWCGVWGCLWGSQSPHAGTASRGFPQIVEKVTLAPGSAASVAQAAGFFIAVKTRDRPRDHDLCCWQPVVLHRGLGFSGEVWTAAGVAPVAELRVGTRQSLVVHRRLGIFVGSTSAGVAPAGASLLGAADVSSASSCWCFTGGWGTSLTSRAASAWSLTFRRRAAVGVSPAAGILLYTRAASAWALTFRRRQLLVLHRRLAHFFHNTGCLGPSADVSSVGSCWCFTGGWATPSTRRGRFGPSSGCGAPRSALLALGRR